MLQTRRERNYEEREKERETEGEREKAIKQLPLRMSLTIDAMKKLFSSSFSLFLRHSQTDFTFSSSSGKVVVSSFSTASRFHSPAEKPAAFRGANRRLEFQFPSSASSCSREQRRRKIKRREEEEEREEEERGRSSLRSSVERLSDLLVEDYQRRQRRGKKKNSFFSDRNRVLSQSCGDFNARRKREEEKREEENVIEFESKNNRRWKSQVQLWLDQRPKSSEKKVEKGEREKLILYLILLQKRRMNLCTCTFFWIRKLQKQTISEFCFITTLKSGRK